MQERTNKIEIVKQGPSNVFSPNKRVSQESQEQNELMNNKMAALYNTNPLNTIPETCEIESRASLLQESLRFTPQAKSPGLL